MSLSPQKTIEKSNRQTQTDGRRQEWRAGVLQVHEANDAWRLLQGLEGTRNQNITY